ncbi:hypothetical protein LCGC14_2018340 [marine sediment metagenome]|uniref:Uncharacterized protein n=1 Tax=marine sediment metagenome TaxID=412755 RepID=A0A0F9HVE2_9ZZZZ
MTTERVIEMIDKLFADTSCSPAETRDKLHALIDHIQNCLAALKSI